jgi:hypothetical protein
MGTQWMGSTMPVSTSNFKLRRFTMLLITDKPKPMLLVLLLWLTQTTHAQTESPFSVRNAVTWLNGDVYFLDAQYSIQIPEYMLDAFEQGFDMPLAVEIKVIEKRRFWVDREIAYIKQQYRLQSHSLLESVSLTDVNQGHRQYFSNIQSALNKIRNMNDFPMLDANTVDNSRAYMAKIRLGVDQVELPLPLKSSSLWKKNWALSSDWFELEVEK